MGGDHFLWASKSSGRASWYQALYVQAAEGASFLNHIPLLTIAHSMAASSPELARAEVSFTNPPWKYKFLPQPVSLPSLPLPFPPTLLLEFHFKALTQLGVVAYTYNICTQVEEAGGLLQVQG